MFLYPHKDLPVTAGLFRLSEYLYIAVLQKTRFPLMQQRTALFILLTTLFAGFSSCKKDLLHWQKQQKLDSHTDHRFNRILFLNDQTGFVVGGTRFGYADILVTHDGGYNWDYMTFPDAGKELFDLTIAPLSRTLYACGFDGKILFSEDSGSTWQFRQLGSWKPYKSIAFTTPTNGIVVGGVSFDIGCKGSINNEGNLNHDDSLGYELNQIRMVDQQTGYMCGYGVMLKTTNGGGNWAFQNVNTDNFTAMDVHDANHIWMCGYGGSIYKTVNGGNNWERLRNGNDLTKPSYHLYDVLFTDDVHGYAVGEKGLVIYTDDGGQHWMEFDRFTSDHLHSICKCPNGDLLVAGENGALYRLLQ